MSRTPQSSPKSLNEWIDQYLSEGLDSVVATLKAVEKVVGLTGQTRRVDLRAQVEAREEHLRECHPEWDGPEG